MATASSFSSRPARRFGLLLGGPADARRETLRAALRTASPAFREVDEAFEDRTVRVAADVTTHLALNQGLTVASLVASAVSLPHWLGFLNPALTIAGVVTGTQAVIQDVKEVRHTLNDPEATRTDKLVDVAHLAVDSLHLAGGVAATVAGFLAITHPVFLGVYAGLQMAGLAVDAGKMAYDVHRKRQMFVYLNQQESQLAAAVQARRPALEAHRSRPAGLDEGTLVNLARHMSWPGRKDHH